MNINDLVEKYIALRDKKTEMKREFEKRTESIDAMLDKAESHIQGYMTSQGMESIKTASGTVYQQVRTSATVADWDSVLAFIKANELWSMLERRVAKSVVEEWRKENNDLPPGLNWVETRVVNVRRS